MAYSVISRTTKYIIAEILKTISRPSRLVLGPLSYFQLWLRKHSQRMLPRYPRLMPFVLLVLPRHWMSSGNGKEFCKVIGYDLLQHDHPTIAWRCLEPSLRAPGVTTDEYIMGAICLYHGLGRFRDAMALLQSANDIGTAEADRRGLGGLSVRVLDNVWARHIGHTATIDYVIKLGILENRDCKDTIIYLPSGSKIANPFLLQQVASHLRIIRDSADLPFDASAIQSVHYDYLAPRLPDGKTGYFWELAGKTYDRWHNEGRGPLFKLPPETEERGREVLQRVGVPRDAWFVTLHVREGKWEGGVPGIHGILNSDMESYLPAISEITRRGGWVIRIGDPGMTRMPKLPNVFDYCHSDIRSDWMDIFLVAGCRFMLGSASGPVLIPPIYGVPAILTNWWPPAQRPWHASDIFIPKLIRRLADGKYLTLSETLREPVAWCHSRRYLQDYEGVRVEEVDSEIITAAVEEMLARTEGDLSKDAGVLEQRRRGDDIYKSFGISGKAQLASGYLRRYGDTIA